VTAPAGFQVSLNNANFASRVQLNPANQKVSKQRIWIRLASGSNARSLSGNVTASSVGAPTKAIRINGRIL
jgi:mevalonate pyrophosphate decarboxylase